MASNKTLNAKNLEALGAERLADLLMETCQGSAVIKRRLRLELAGEQGVKAIASEVRKRLATIKRAKSYIDWNKTKAFLNDLEMQRKMIMEKVAPEDPAEAFELLWQFVGIAGSVYERVDDSNGFVGDEFRFALSLFAELGPKASFKSSPQKEELADRIFTAITNNDYGEYDGLISYLGSTLGDIGLEHLKKLVVAHGKKPMPKELNREDNTIYIVGGSRGISLDKDFARRRRDDFVRYALQEIADQQGDVDAFIAQQTKETKEVPAIAAEIANRLLSVGRAKEALKALDVAKDNSRRGWIPEEWNDARAAALTALGRNDEVQKFHWNCFEQTLSPKHLRALMDLLPDFEDFECEQKAFKFALTFPNVHTALDFFISWPSLEKASALILTRHGELDGNFYEVMSPASNDIQGAYPLAAVLLRRLMIDFSLEKARSSRYKHAARHLLECQSANHVIEDYGNFPSHTYYEAKLRTDHGRKSSFWSLVE